MIRLHSFDVFDTLLTRPYTRPTVLFELVGGQLAERWPGRFDAAAYHAARRRAEDAARRAAQPRDDCTFAEIFAAFDELDAWGVEREVAMSLELAAETRALRPVAVNLERVRALRAAGHAVVFISDMYLPRSFVHDRLCAVLGEIAPETVYVSGELGLSKHSGRLFDHVLQRHGIAPRELHHVGDNAHSDVAVPAARGIVTEHYRAIACNRYERLPRPWRLAPAWLVSHTGAARATRLAQAGGEAADASLARVASGVVAPVLTAFVAWVLGEARRRGIARLYFVSRDGQIFHRVANVIRRDGDPECRYLYGSRQAWFLPAVVEPSASSLEWAWVEGMSRDIEAILRRLELDTPEVHAVLDAAGFDAASRARAPSPAEFERFQALLLQDPLRETLRRRAAARRATVQAYLRQEGLFDAVAWALVDVGWSLRSQRALGRILAAAGRTGGVTEFYFGVGRYHVDTGDLGAVLPFVSQPGSDMRGAWQLRWFFRSVLLIEHLFTLADHPTAQGYAAVDDRIEPVFKADNRNPRVTAFAALVHEAVLRYAGEIRDSAFVDPSTRAFQRRALGMMYRFCIWPQRTDVEGLAWLPTNKDQSHDSKHQSRLASALTVHDVLAMLRHVVLRGRGGFFSHDFTWLMGSAALSSTGVRYLCRALYSMHVALLNRPRGRVRRRD